MTKIPLVLLCVCVFIYPIALHCNSAASKFAQRHYKTGTSKVPVSSFLGQS